MREVYVGWCLRRLCPPTLLVEGFVQYFSLPPFLLLLSRGLTPLGLVLPGSTARHCPTWTAGPAAWGPPFARPCSCGRRGPVPLTITHREVHARGLQGVPQVGIHHSF